MYMCLYDTCTLFYSQEGGILANSPVLGLAICPYCKSKNAIIWNGNRKTICIYCEKPFKLKRQKLLKVMKL